MRSSCSGSNPRVRHSGCPPERYERLLILVSREPLSPNMVVYTNVYLREKDCHMTASTMTAPRFPRAAGVAVTTWLALALLAGATGFLAQLPFPGPPLILPDLLPGPPVAGSHLPRLR